MFITIASALQQRALQGRPLISRAEGGPVGGGGNVPCTYVLSRGCSSAFTLDARRLRVHAYHLLFAF